MNPYTDLIHRVKECNLLGSCAGVLGWDERTYMPRQGSNHRAEQMALLARMTHEMMVAPEMGSLLAQLENHPTTDSVASANVREIRRTYNRAVKMPKELV